MDNVILGQITCSKCGCTYPTIGIECPHCNPPKLKEIKPCPIDCWGNVTDIELAKKILVEFFTTGEYKFRDSQFRDKDGSYKAFLEEIENELVSFDGGFTFMIEDNLYHFGGPEGSSGYLIQEMSHYIEEAVTRSPEMGLAFLANVLNDEHTVFYEVDGEIKCFVLHELD